MLELPIKDYRVVYAYSQNIYIEISKIDLDWGWVVRRNGEILMMDTAASESFAEGDALEFVEGCQCVL